MTLSTGRYLVREATKADLYDLWHWRNDKVTRWNSLNTKRISFRKHRWWFTRRLKSQDCRIYIMIRNSKKIGAVRFDSLGKRVVQVSIIVNPAFRGRGFGKLMLKKASKLVKSKRPERIQKAIIKDSNLASRKIFSANGFINIHEIKSLGYSIWIKN